MSIYNGLLKLYELPGKIEKLHMVFKYDSPELIMLKKKYNLEKITKGKTDFQRAYNLMVWLHSIFIHDPNYVNSPEDNADKLIKRLMNLQPVNCHGAAIIMTECLLSLGIKASMIWLLSADPYDSDCHVVPIVYCSEYNKWIMFDSTVNCVCYDETGEPLSIFEVRQKLANNDDIEYSSTLRFIRTKCSYNYQKRMFSGYLSKNMFMFKGYCVNNFGFEYDIHQKYIYIKPNNFDLKCYCNIQEKHWGQKIHSCDNSVCIGVEDFLGHTETI